ncbi:hypothetical protein GFS31_24210 [Leptolyngbya sp. BL0902]|uniref:hypothetical protein n=1 Tax=Leptolyngbya sp. BL0902 TaxID=1115757 RepID=UPI0018E78A91|nr:hypothetical protein [Leptolyngbya sp. BL0902]QQE65733.1 hypothetical protein GFS31_24210 [Leptolyngbya sp. BL0902]
MDFLLFAAAVFGLVWLLVLVLAVPVLLVWAVRRQRPPISPRRQRRPRLLTATPHQIRAAVKEISIYTHNEEISARLLHHTRLENRGKPLSWCVEKTIHDLVRDRR